VDDDDNGVENQVDVRAGEEARAEDGTRKKRQAGGPGTHFGDYN
jgi:hypothetical protein